VRCWLLLCSDLAIRSGTAARLSPDNYDRERKVLTFTTKYGAAQTLPVTHELSLLLDQAIISGRPFVAQLPRRQVSATRAQTTMGTRALYGQFHKILKRCKITRAIRPHDLRRTTVRRVYRESRDLLLAQALLGHSSLNSTLWYLQGEIVPVGLQTLEAAKLAPLTERPQ
jgi:integrase